VEHESLNPRYAVGDFVKCWYTIYQYYYYYHDEWEENEPVYGVIVEVDYAEYDDVWPHDIIYVVFCTDGIYRFFVEGEVWKMA
jgi:hypothetical protein